MHGWKLDAYADIFHFPWLKFGIDAPVRGSEYLCQLTYTPNRKISLVIRYRSETKPANPPGNTSVTNEPVIYRRSNFRVHVNCQLNTDWTVRSRAEFVKYGMVDENAEEGFLSFIDVLYKPMRKPYGLVARWQYFETDSYDSRIYAYENDVQYSYSAPAFSGKGIRYYVSMNHDIGKKISVWLRVAQTMINANSIKTEARLQLRFAL